MNRVSPETGAVELLPGLSPACHEFYAEAIADAAICSGVAVGLAATRMSSRPVLWIRTDLFCAEAGMPHHAGLTEFGLDPARVIFVRERDCADALQAGLEGARYAALGAVIVEIWGITRAYDLTASRRLALAARGSGVPVFVSRAAVSPAPSAAETRWLVRASPSRMLDAKAPGSAAFDLILLRARNGQEGLHYHMEWDRDARCFITETGHAIPEAGSPRTQEQASSNLLHDASGKPPLSGLVVPVSFNRPGSQPDVHAPRRSTG